MTRWTLGFADPNQAGLLGELAAIAGLLALLRGSRRAVAVAGAALAALALGTVVATGSRSALLGVIVATAVAASGAFRSRRALLAGALVLVAAVVLGGLRPGSADPARDGSLVNRTHLWRAAPAIFRDFPAGCAEPGDIYSNWYQPVAVGESYTNLVSAHLQVLALLSHPWRVLYVLLWFGSGLLAWRAPAGRRWFLAAWTAFALSGCAVLALCHPLFAIVAWAHLAALLGAHAANRGARARAPALAATLVPAAIAVAGIGWLALRLAPAGDPVPVRFAADGPVMLGEPAHPLAATIIAPSRRRCASTYGLDLRRLAAEERCRLLVVPDGASGTPPDPPAPPLFVSSAGCGQAWFGRWRPRPDLPWAMLEPRDLPPAGPGLATIFCLDPLAGAGARTVVERHYRAAGYAVIDCPTFADAVRRFIRTAQDARTSTAW